MVRYAHGVQVPRLTTEVLSNANLFPPVITRVTAGSGGGSSALVPWTWIGNTDRALEFRFGTSAPTTSPAGGAPPIDPNQPEARQWVLARKTALLADDGGHAVFYPEPREYAVAESLGPSSAPSIFGDLSNGQATPFPAGNAYRRWHWRESRDRNWIMTSANMIPSPILQSGWVDVSSSDLDKVRRQIAPTLRLQDPLDIGNLVGYVQSVSLPWAIGFGGASGAPLGWPSGSGAPPWPSDGSIVGIGNNQQLGSVAEYTSQRDRIMRGCFATPASGTAPSVGVLGWPRSEKVVTDTDRKTELLVSPTLLTNCSSFRIDWTWQPGTGRQTTAEGEVVGAVVGLGSTSGVEMGGIVSGAGGLGWFGLPDVSDQPEVVLAQDALSFPGHSNQHMVQVARSIEGAPGNASSPAVTAPFPGQDRIRVYTAVFGFNQDDAYVVSPDGIEVLRDDYTPWPSQIRVTATIHDPRLVLDRGREVQFVLDVPRRRKD
jgi:hypothetical protein